MKQIFLSVAGTALGLGLALSSAQGADACEGIRAQATAQLEANNLPALQETHKQARAKCDPAFSDWLGMKIASRMYNDAIDKNEVDEAALEKALLYGRPWPILATLGDLAEKKSKWAKAALRYQEALTEIQDESRTPDAPSKQIITELLKKAEQTALLASDTEYVQTPRGRNNENAGTASKGIRGVAVKKVALPVQFEFDQAEFTPNGLKAANDIANFLKNESGTKQIVLVGHTDPKGDNAYNQRLSLRRAERLAQHLRANGVTIPIRVEGRGEASPYQPDQAAKYSTEQRHQMDRRVELIRP